MPTVSDDWRRLVEAAHRKLAIASYHCDSLERELSSAGSGQSDAPSIPVQAHFEGVIVSVIAAVDQVVHACKSALQFKLNKGEDLVEGAFNRLTHVIPEVGSWYSAQIGRDLRRVRVRMVHYSYAKTPQGPIWFIESADTDFQGSRQLLPYARSAVEYGKSLGTLLPKIEIELGQGARQR